MQRYILGADPGLQGALAILAPDGTLEGLWVDRKPLSALLLWTWQASQPDQALRGMAS